jgi:hypothetical protein
MKTVPCLNHVPDIIWDSLTVFFVDPSISRKVREYRQIFGSCHSEWQFLLNLGTMHVGQHEKKGCPTRFSCNIKESFCDECSNTQQTTWIICDMRH